MIKQVGFVTISKRYQEQLPTTFSREKKIFMKKKGGITTHG